MRDGVKSPVAQGGRLPAVREEAADWLRDRKLEHKTGRASFPQLYPSR